MNNDLADNPIWLRGLLIAALLSGTGGSAVGLLQGDSRYTAEDAARDFALRDERISALRGNSNTGNIRHGERIRRLEERLTIHEHDTRTHLDDRVRHGD